MVLTEPGKVFGLHSGDGRILWASNAAALPTTSSSSSKQYLRVWRRFHDLTHAPQVVVLTAGQQRSGAHVLNAHTGQQLQHIELPYGVGKVSCTWNVCVRVRVCVSQGAWLCVQSLVSYEVSAWHLVVAVCVVPACLRSGCVCSACAAPPAATALSSTACPSTLSRAPTACQAIVVLGACALPPPLPPPPPHTQVIPVQTPVHDGAAEQFSFLLVEQQQPTRSSSSSNQPSTPRVHLVPDIPSVTAAVAAGASNTFFWLQQPQQQQQPDAAADTVLQGYSLAAGAQADGEGLLPVVPAWRVVLPGKLLAMASRDPTEPVHSYVKV